MPQYSTQLFQDQTSKTDEAGGICSMHEELKNIHNVNSIKLKKRDNCKMWEGNIANILEK
jgi:hypothetical protein